MTFYLLLWLGVLPIDAWIARLNAVVGGTPLPYGFAPVWSAVSPLVVVLILMSIARDIVALIRPHWLTLRGYTGLALNVGGLLVLIRLVRADAVFVVTDPAGIGAAHIGHFNTLFFIAFCLVAVYRRLHQHSAGRAAPREATRVVRLDPATGYNAAHLVKLSDIGPGLLLAATGIGVGDMVSSTIAGAEYGLTLVWALAAGVVLKFAITEGAARWQLGTGTTLIEGWRDHLPRAAVIAFFIYFIVWSYFVSSALVTASALVPAAIIPSVPLPVWGVIHAVGAFVMVWFGRYERFLAIVKWFIGLKFGAIIASALLIVLWSGADWSGAGARSPFSTAYTLSLIGGVGGTVTLLSYGYWMREAGWAGVERMKAARGDLTLSFTLVFVFCISMIFLSTQINWTGQILDEGPRLCLLLADRIGQEIGPIGRGVFLLGFWGAAFSSVLGVYHGVPFLFDDMLHLWRRQPAGGQRGKPYRAWAAYLALAAISALVIRRPVWLVFAYTVVGSMFFPFVISTLLWLNNKRNVRATRNGVLVNVVLSAALSSTPFLPSKRSE